MAAANVELDPIEAGSTWSISVIWSSEGTPIDVTGYTGECQVRRARNATSELICAPAVDVSSGGGVIVLSLSSSETTDLDPGTYVYELRLTSIADPSLKDRLAEGVVKVTPATIYPVVTSG